jgi:hypothetical protein
LQGFARGFLGRPHRWRGASDVWLIVFTPPTQDDAKEDRHTVPRPVDRRDSVIERTRMSPYPKTPPLRKKWAALIAIPALTALTACGVQATAAGEADSAALLAPLASEVPAGTELVVGDPATQVALELSGESKKFTFPVKFANLSGGPQTAEAFRANALDVGSVADIPPIHATWTGLDVRIVASQYRVDAVNFPLYELGIAPGAGIKELTDLRGRKIETSTPLPLRPSRSTRHPWGE